MKRKYAVPLLASLFSALLCMPVRADKPQKPPAGMGRYILFIKTAPPVPAGQTPKKIVPPDVAKMGGVVLQKKDGYQIVHLPFPALKQLRKDENVDDVQRIWMGESPDEWRATEAIASDSSLMRIRSDSLTETASWGPKNYSYDGNGNIKQVAELDANGNIKVESTEKFRYDGAIRLKQAVVNGVTETYTYDAFGNLTQKQTGNAVSSLNVDSTSNRVSNYIYDIAGNVTQDPRRIYSYDALGMLIGVTGYPKRMFYDANDERVGFTLGSDGSFSRWIISDFEGRPLREFRTDYPLSSYQDAEWIWTEDWVYAGEQLVGGETAGPWGTMEPTVPVDRRRRHYHLDVLGSVRLITTESGAIALGVHNYYPYGTEQSMFYQEEYNFGGTGGIRPEPMRFTGQYRDFNSYWNVDNTDYLDYMHARFYDPQQERFLSVDPTCGIPEQPQSWNRYAYALDNPLTYTDPSGRYPCKVKLKGLTPAEEQKSGHKNGEEVDGECVDGRDADKEAEEKRRLGPVQPWTTPNQPLQPFQRRPELPIMMMTRMLSDFLDVNSSFLDNYHKMRDANTKGADKYFHCMAHCRASRSGPYAAGFAEHLGNAREVWDQHVKGYPRWDSVSDQAANAAGRNGPLSMPCEAVCSQFRPAGLSSNY